MADTTVTPTEPQTPEPAQDGIDWTAEARKWERRAKENKAALDKLQAEHDSVTSRLSELETQNASLTEQVTGFERTALVAKIAGEKGVPADALRGETEEELTAHAETLKGLLAPQAPVVDGQAKVPGTPPADPARETVRTLFNAPE